MHNSYRVGILDLVHSSGAGAGAAGGGEEAELNARWSVGRKLVFFASFTFLIDIGMSLFSLSAFHNFEMLTTHMMFSSDILSFRSNISDLLLLSVLRALVLPVVAAVAVYIGNPDFGRGQERKRCTSRNDDGDGDSGHSHLRDPLLSSSSAISSSIAADDEMPASKEEAGKEDREKEVRVDMSEDWQRGKRAVEDLNDTTLQRLKASAAARKHVFLSLMFAFSTGVQIYTGIKCLNFSWDRYGGSEDVVAPLVTSSVFFINIEVWLLREFVSEITRSRGLFVKSLHQHPLFFDKRVASHWCDLCGQRVNRAFRCKQCDFDACEKCVSRKRTANAGENLIRSDRGVVETKPMSTMEYFCRAIKLTGPESKLFMFAFIFLTLTAVATLALPNTQGQIINKIIANDKSSFLFHLKLYIGIMVAMGIFNGIKGLLFTVVARRIAFHARNKLFGAILRQDIAFFDGTTSGRLTSRLTNDIGMMLSPIQSTLSTLLYNIVMLFGGVGMCFFTSYQLSMLACTSFSSLLCPARLFLRQRTVFVSRRLSRTFPLHIRLHSHNCRTNTVPVGHVRELVPTAEPARPLCTFRGELGRRTGTRTRSNGEGVFAGEC